jgi:membrane protein YqaA with SNARE-associated domain
VVSKKSVLKVFVFIVVFLSFSYFLFRAVNFVDLFSSLGFFKYIFISILSIFGSNILTSSFLYPVLFFAKQSGTNLFLLAVLAAIGGTIGDLLFVYFGKGINEESKKKHFKKIIRFFEKHQDSYYLRLFIFLYAAFFPMSNEFMTLALGYLKYPIKKIWPPLILGNILYYIILISLGGAVWSLIF